MNKYQKIYMAAMVAAIPPWGFIFKPFGAAFLFGGFAIQVVGVAVIVWLLATKRPRW